MHEFFRKFEWVGIAERIIEYMNWVIFLGVELEHGTLVPI
jgi:hypothetical protein